MDDCTGRPLVLLPMGLARLLTPDRIDGGLILALLLCLGNALLLASILAHFFRGDRLLPLVAAGLLLVNPCDSSRFYVLWTSNYYWTAILFLLSALRLYLASYERGSRPLLAAACVLLGAGVLCYELFLPLALLAPIVLGASVRTRERVIPWAVAWYGTMGLFSARYV